MGENRIYHESGIHKRIACLIGAVLVVLMCITAAVPVSAADSDFLAQYPYIAQDSFGIIYLSKAPLAFFPHRIANSTPQHIAIMESNPTSADWDYITILVPKYVGDTVSYQVYTAGNRGIKTAIIDTNDFTIDFDSGLPTAYLEGSSSSFANAFDLSIDLTKYRFFTTNWLYDQYHITANYQVQTKYPNNTSLPTTTFGSSQITVNANFDISDAVGQSGITPEQLSSAINNALSGSTSTITGAISGQTSSINGTINSNGSSIVGAINNQTNSLNNSISGQTNSINGAIQTQTNTLIAYGNNFIQFLPTDKADTLETKQNALHDAESALDTKSKSLVSKASAGLATATASAGQLAANLAQPVAAVSTVINDFTATVPDEVMPVLTAAPLLSFIVWLIGLRR